MFVVNLVIVAPSEAPESLSVVYITSTTVTLTWDPPPHDSHNGVIREYTVRITGSDNQLLYNATKNSITIPELLPYTDYEISVSAYTVANGPFSSYLYVTSNEAGIFNYIFNASIMCVL